MTRPTGKTWLLTLIVVATSGCVSLPLRDYSEREQAIAEIADIPDARFWADDPAAFIKARPAPTPGKSQAMLAISGGSDDGAYGAGFLNGWSQSGKRPEFTVVTGVSTGALLAPFALLGERYDDRIKAAYTTISQRDIYHRRPAPLALLSTSVATTEPLWELLNHYVTDAVIDEVAAAHRAGRRLFVGTANLDAQRGVVWNMGAIATSGAADRYRLFRRVLLASSAVPALFPPVIIDARAGGKPIREAHVDGATAGSLLVVPPGVVTTSGIASTGAELYLLVNGALGGDFKIVKGGILSIAGRAFTLATTSAVREQTATAYLWAKRYGAHYHLTYIDSTFEHGPPHKPFDTAYMNRLYEFGLRAGRASRWALAPPSGDPAAPANGDPADQATPNAGLPERPSLAMPGRALVGR